MEVTLRGLARHKCIVYLGNILVMGQSFQEHLSNLQEVLSRLQLAGLRLKPRKCYLIKTEAKYLGYVVSHAGVNADPVKVEAVRSYARLQNLKQLKIFSWPGVVLQEVYTTVLTSSCTFVCTDKEGCAIQLDCTLSTYIRSLETDTNSSSSTCFPRLFKDFHLRTKCLWYRTGSCAISELRRW